MTTNSLDLTGLSGKTVMFVREGSSGFILYLDLVKFDLDRHIVANCQIESRVMYLAHRSGIDLLSRKWDFLSLMINRTRETLSLHGVTQK